MTADSSSIIALNLKNLLKVSSKNNESEFMIVAYNNFKFKASFLLSNTKSPAP